MDSIDWVFVVVVILSVSLGTAAATDYGGTLMAKERAMSLSDDIEISISEVTVSDDRLSFTATIRNPTSADVTVTGVYMSVFDGTGNRLAYGGAPTFEPTFVPAGTTRAVQVSVPLTTAQADSLQRALASGNGFVISLRAGMTFDSVVFVVHSEETHVTNEVR
jgi:LEA14-like dessication related protein